MTSHNSFYLQRRAQWNSKSPELFSTLTSQIEDHVNSIAIFMKISRFYKISNKQNIKNTALEGVAVQSLSRVQLFATPWTAVCQAFLSVTNSQSLLKLMFIESVMPSNHLVPFSHLQSLLASLPISRLFASGGQITGVSASASVLPMNIQD